jgi:hypothetical protein
MCPVQNVNNVPVPSETLSVLSTSVTKQTGDMVYGEARRLRILGIRARTTMMYAMEREWGLRQVHLARRFGASKLPNLRLHRHNGLVSG